MHRISFRNLRMRSKGHGLCEFPYGRGNRKDHPAAICGNSAGKYYKDCETVSGTGYLEENLVFEKSSFELLENILEEAGELPERVPYEDLVTTEFAEQAGK